MTRATFAAFSIGMVLMLVCTAASAQHTGGYTLTDVAPHAAEDDCWVAVDNSVYVITDYLPRHSGEPEDLAQWCGKDATKAFTELDRKARNKALRAIQEYRIGALIDADARR